MLRERLYSYLEAVEPEAESGFDLDGSVLADRRGGRLARRARRQRPRSASPSPARSAAAPAQLTGIAVATGDGPAAWFDPAALDEDDERAVAAWLADPDRPKVIHDAKPALLAFRAHGWALAGVAVDTALAAYLAKPDQRAYDLTDLALRYLKRELRVDAPDDGQLTLDGFGGDDGGHAPSRT